MKTTSDEHGIVAPDDPIRLVPTRSEADIAADIKRKIEEAYVPVCAIMDEAGREGFQVLFDNIIYQGPPQMRHKVNGLRLVKVYA
jgi:hypothetical protein